MIYPENFERKIGFNEIRTLLKGRCFSSLGTEWVDKELHFMHDFEQIKQALDEAREYKIFEEQTDEEVETEFFDVREALLRARPERTFLEELDLLNAPSHPFCRMQNFLPKRLTMKTFLQPMQTPRITEDKLSTFIRPWARWHAT